MVLASSCRFGCQTSAKMSDCQTENQPFPPYQTIEKTHAIFIPEMNQRNERACRPPLCLCICQTLLTAQLQLLQIGAREPRSRLSVSASLGKVAKLDEARREKCPPHRENWNRKGLRRVGKFQTFRAAFAHRSLEPIISLCEASDSYIRMFILPRGNRFVTCLPERQTDSIHAFPSRKLVHPFLL